MLKSLLVAGIAMGSVYALVGISYNLMYNTSKVVSLTSGQFAMVGAVAGAYLVSDLDLNPAASLVLVLVIGMLAGCLTEVIAVRPVLKRIDTHLYVLSTLALALIVEEAVALWWGTEPRPFPRLLENVDLGVGSAYWLPVLALIVVVAALTLLNRRTLVGRAFLAIAEDSTAARALGLPDRAVRMGGYMLAGVVGALAGFVGGQLTYAYFSIGVLLVVNGFVAIAIGGLGDNRGAVIGGLVLGVAEQVANYLFGGGYKGVTVFLILMAALLVLPNGIFGKAEARRV
ncbi:branched-chain amino acid ABC transporter permease [Mycobacterium sp. NPDC003449]